MRALTGPPRRLVQLVALEVGQFAARASVASSPVIELERPRRLANSRAVNTAEGGPGWKQRQTLACAPGVWASFWSTGYHRFAGFSSNETNPARSITMLR